MFSLGVFKPACPIGKEDKARKLPLPGRPRRIFSIGVTAPKPPRRIRPPNNEPIGIRNYCPKDVSEISTAFPIANLRSSWWYLPDVSQIVAFRTGTSAITAGATGRAFGVVSAGRRFEETPIAANAQANNRNRLKKLVMRAATMKQAYLDATVVPTYRKASSGTGPKSRPNVLQMETIHIMDSICSNRRHLIVYGEIASPGTSDT